MHMHYCVCSGFISKGKVVPSSNEQGKKDKPYLRDVDGDNGNDQPTTDNQSAMLITASLSKHQSFVVVVVTAFLILRVVFGF